MKRSLLAASVALLVCSHAPADPFSLIRFDLIFAESSMPDVTYTVGLADGATDSFDEGIDAREPPWPPYTEVRMHTLGVPGCVEPVMWDYRDGFCPVDVSQYWMPGPGLPHLRDEVWGLGWFDAAVPDLVCMESVVPAATDPIPGTLYWDLSQAGEYHYFVKLLDGLTGLPLGEEFRLGPGGSLEFEVISHCGVGPAFVISARYIPEPGTMGLLLSGFLGMACLSLRRRRVAEGSAYLRSHLRQVCEGVSTMKTLTVLIAVLGLAAAASASITSNVVFTLTDFSSPDICVWTFGIGIADNATDDYDVGLDANEPPWYPCGELRMCSVDVPGSSGGLILDYRDGEERTDMSEYWTPAAGSSGLRDEAWGLGFADSAYPDHVWVYGHGLGNVGSTTATLVWDLTNAGQYEYFIKRFDGWSLQPLGDEFRLEPGGSFPVEVISRYGIGPQFVISARYVPEPGTLAMLLSGFLGMVGLSLRRR